MIMMTGIKNHTAMKKSVIFTIVLAALALSCAKEVEINEQVVVKGNDAITAYAPAESKTTVDGIDVKWASGDALTVFDAGDNSYDFTIDPSDVGKTTAKFTGDLGGNTLGNYVLYPHNGDNAKAGEMVAVIYKSSFAYGNAPLPMLGTKSSGNEFSFEHIGGAIRIQYRNVPATAASFEFEEVSATPQKVCGAYDITDITSSVSGTFGSSATSKVIVSSLPGTPNLEFVIPLPAGSYKFTVRLKDNLGNVINASEKTVGKAKSVSVGHIVNLGAIILPTAVTVSEDISAFFDSDDNENVVCPFYLDENNIIQIDQVGGGNNGKYYNSDNSLRFYSSSSGALKISLASGYTLQKVNVTFSGTLSGLTSGSDKEESSTSASYSCTANAKVTSISVTYIATTNTADYSKVPTPVIADEDNVVTITCALAGTSIYYTTDGSTPSSSSTLYEGPFEINSDVTIKAIAYKAGYADSNVSAGHDASYDSSLAVANPTISCTANYVTISCTTPGTTIRYTTDGSTSPSRTVGTVYSAPFLIAADTKVKAIAYKLGYVDSSVVTEDCDYENVLATPTNVDITDINLAEGSISIAFDAVTNATKYAWTISTEDDWANVAGNIIADGEISANSSADYSYKKTGLTGDISAGEAYYLYVQAIDAGGTFDPSARGTAHAILYQHIFTTKPDTGNNIALSWVNWNISATNLGSYNSANYAGVQLGTSSKNGSISLTSSSAWGAPAGTYNGYTTIKKVVLWLNLGGTSVTPSVTVGGKTASTTGSVTKNSSAGSYAQTSRVVFTPASDGKTGVIVANVSTVKAGYICALEVLSK